MLLNLFNLTEIELVLGEKTPDMGAIVALGVVRFIRRTGILSRRDFPKISHSAKSILLILL
jgi:hypothetical protein